MREDHKDDQLSPDNHLSHRGQTSQLKIPGWKDNLIGFTLLHFVSISKCSLKNKVISNFVLKKKEKRQQQLQDTF